MGWRGYGKREIDRERKLQRSRRAGAGLESVGDVTNVIGVVV